MSLATLPRNCKLRILGFLDAKEDLASALCVSVEFLSLSNEQELWRLKCKKFQLDFGNLRSLRASLSEPDWKALYEAVEGFFAGGKYVGWAAWTDPPGFSYEQDTFSILHFDYAKKRILGEGHTNNAPEGFASRWNFFQIEGSFDKNFGMRLEKKYARHTSHYTGTVDVLNRKLEGRILYEADGVVWKGVYMLEYREVPFPREIAALPIVQNLIGDEHALDLDFDFDEVEWLDDDGPD